MKTVDKIKAAVEPVLAAEGLEIIEVEYRREPVGMVLRFFIDHPDGIDLDKCSSASGAISGVLDDSDIIHSAYVLEVSSAGIERPLTKPDHYRRFIGSEMALKIAAPRNGRKKFAGVISDADDTGFSMTVDGVEERFSYEEVVKAHLIYKD